MCFDTVAVDRLSSAVIWQTHSSSYSVSIETTRRRLGSERAFAVSIVCSMALTCYITIFRQLTKYMTRCRGMSKRGEEGTGRTKWTEWATWTKWPWWTALGNAGSYGKQKGRWSPAAPLNIRPDSLAANSRQTGRTPPTSEVPSAAYPCTSLRRPVLSAYH